MYSPAMDHQRYCKDCKKWFHDHCIKLWEDLSGLKADGPEHILMETVPVMRGCNGREGRSWDTVGNGRKLLAFHISTSRGDFPSNWKKKLGSSFVKGVTTNQWNKYKCPQCKECI
jgi:hypothetical protein